MLGRMNNVAGMALTDDVALCYRYERALVLYISPVSSAGNIPLSGDHTIALCAHTDIKVISWLLPLGQFKQNDCSVQM